MTALQDRRARLLASLYASYGVAADWASANGGAVTRVTLRRMTEDGEAGFGDNFAVVRKEIFRVRSAELPDPGKDDLVTLINADGSPGALFRILATPRSAKSGGEWVCEPAQVRT